MKLGKDWQCLSLVKLNHLDASKVKSACSASIAARRTVGWIVYYPMNGFVKPIDNLQRKNNCLTHSTIDNLVSMELIFLPPKTALKLKPMV